MPTGEAFGRAGKDILVLAVESSSCVYRSTIFDEDLPAALEEGGYTATVVDRITQLELTTPLPDSCDQLWIPSTNPCSSGCLDPPELAAIDDFRQSGRGPPVMVDHDKTSDHFAADANQISAPLGVTFFGWVGHGPNGPPIAPDFEAHALFAGVDTISCHSSAAFVTADAPLEVTWIRLVSTCF